MNQPIEVKQVDVGGLSANVPMSGVAQEVRKPEMFVKEPEVPTQVGPEGIRYDFNYGCRVQLPELPEGQSWRIKLSDTETNNIIFDSVLRGGYVQSSKKYFIPFRIEVWKNDVEVFKHDLSFKNGPVLIQIPVGTLGDAIAWFPYVPMFQEKHGCKVTCGMSDVIIPLFEKVYPNVDFQSLSKIDASKYYASYRIGLYFDDWECTHQPVDFRYAGLHKTAAYILGVDPVEAPPKLDLKNSKRKIEEPYVCIATQSSTQCKYWNHPGGWIAIVKWLKESGYRVICIDRDPVWGQGVTFNQIPHGCEDMTGPLPLMERAELLKHADFFVGLSSGLSWLAWAVGTPVVMISGFTHPNNEFYTPHRVINYHTCNSCWNDPKHIFNHFDFFWCPRHKGTDRAYECTKLITVDHVKSVISRVPGFLKK
jgi:autotransporter strand-loop-strand O-heptosyltransferase